MKTTTPAPLVRLSRTARARIEAAYLARRNLSATRSRTDAVPRYAGAHPTTRPAA